MAPVEAADATAQRLLDGARETRRAVVLLHARPALAEIWWADEQDRSAHETVVAAEPSAWTRLDVIRVGETVRARVGPPIATPPGAPPETPIVVATTTSVAAAPAVSVAVADPFLRVAGGVVVSGLGAVGAAGGVTLASSGALLPRTRVALALTIPTDEVSWQASNGPASTWDTWVAASLERAFPLRSWGPGQLELRAAAGLAVHHRTTSGEALVPYYVLGDRGVSYSAGPTLAGTIAYRVRGDLALLATAGGGVTFPDGDFVVQGYSLSSPGHFNWSLGLMAELGVWMRPPLR
jgi:hypothetical protein